MNIKNILVLLLLSLVSGCFGNKVIVDADREALPTTAPVTAEAASVNTQQTAAVCCDLTGDYTYSGKGIARIEQTGSDVHMYLTWTPKGQGPHYEVKGTLHGNTITGKWYALYNRKGWFDFTSVVSPSGKLIDFAQSSDPIRSNFNKLVLINNELLKGSGIAFIQSGDVDSYMQKQEVQLRNRLKDTGIDVLRISKHILLKLPNNITFDTDSDELKPRFAPALNSIVTVLTEYNSTLVTTIGYTDNVGTVEHNQKLSERRAQSLMAYLTTKGINTHRLTAIGRGQFQPVASNDTSEGRAMNRRVEIMLEPLQQ